MAVVEEPRATQGPAGTARPQGQAPRWWVVGLTLALIPLQAAWLIPVETQLGSFSTNNTDVSLFFTSVVALLVAGLANRWLSRRRPSWALRPPEMAVLYIGLTIAAAFAGSDLLQNLTPVLLHPFQFGTPESGWPALFHRYIPGWFAPRDPAVLRAYYNGNALHLLARQAPLWIVPLASWGLFLGAIGVVMLSINTLLKAQWADRERLSFPVIQLPVEMVRPGGLDRLLANPLFLLGAGGTLVLELLNTFHSTTPSVPYVPLAIQNVGQYLTDPPWNALASGPPLFISWIPFAIGVSYFLPLDLAFSAWAFFLLRRAEDIGAVYWGLRGPGASAASARFPFVQEQASGAWIALFAVTLWSARGHLRSVLRAALGLEREMEAGQARTYRMALAGLVLGMLYLLGFSRASGMVVWVACAYFAIYWALQVTMTRIRAQLGPPMLELYFVNPEQILVTVTGSRVLSPASLTVLSYYFWFNRCYRCQPMAHELEAFRLADASGLGWRRVAPIVVGALGLGIGFGLWAILRTYYDVGQTSAKILTYRTGVGAEAFNRLANWMQNPAGPDITGIFWMAGAALFTFALAGLQARFAWWPLHPVGYAFSVCYAMEYWWSTIALVWLVKLLLVRYGGMKLYARARPFFLGLILGDAVAAVGVALVSWAFGIPALSRY